MSIWYGKIIDGKMWWFRIRHSLSTEEASGLVDDVSRQCDNGGMGFTDEYVFQCRDDESFEFYNRPSLDPPKV